eukprot:RCo052776
MILLKQSVPPGLDPSSPSRAKAVAKPPPRVVPHEPPAEPNPQLREARLRSERIRQEYIQCLGRMQYCEEAEKKATVRLQAAQRLQQMVDEKRKVDERRQAERAFVRQLAQEEMQRKHALFNGERQRREQTRRKMEDLFMARRAEVDSLKDESRKTKEDHSKLRNEELTGNREAIRQEREHRKAQRLTFAEQHQAELQQDRDQLRQALSADLSTLKASREDELRRRARVAAGIKSSVRASQGKLAQKKAITSQNLAQEFLQERLDKHHQEIAFYTQEIDRVHQREREARQRMELQQAKLRASVMELGDTVASTSPALARQIRQGDGT